MLTCDHSVVIDDLLSGGERSEVLADISEYKLLFSTLAREGRVSKIGKCQATILVVPRGTTKLA